ncbi:UvrD-helicase domain-containing protein [Brachybacterium sp. JHP9]|uniref:DNA 3'-5' helicase n=1 Tax=Brachybacterium equifaecis TaxID=2910770 RepID=A0ABT0QYA2_9MICO|nr:UvrD-helicase domain-containing protein [Brachybacterium equifaecis]MCL6422641.1 UvrD-helicase domain-containing protein [Brachybacterium equifaecis]
MSYTLINASAGSGKTYTLTTRIAELTATTDLRPEEIIATTFTRRAAADLSDRLRRAMLDRGLVREARGVEAALIGTVNSVAGRLLTEFALDAGISPDVRILDEVTQKSAFSAAISRTAAVNGAAAGDMLARTENDGEEDPSFFGEHASWRRAVRDLAASARTNLISADALRAAAEETWQEYRATALPEPGEDRRRAWAGQLRLALDGLAVEPSAAVAKQLDGLNALHRRLVHPRHGTDRTAWSDWTRIAKVASGKLGDPAAKGYAFVKDVDAALIGLALEIQEDLLANPALQADIRALIALVMRTAADSLDAYAEHKRAAGLIDYIDQEVQLLDLLRTSDRARLAIARRFRLLAVDEFQDTSPVQLALFLELGRLVDEVIWVGDPKQAIYGFREADPALMLGILEQIGSGTGIGQGGSVETLSLSWRSQREVLELSNRVFTGVFPDLPRERVVLAPAEQADASRAAAGRPPGRLEAWTPTDWTRSLSAEKHARAIAAGVVELISEGRADPQDLAVLTRSNGEAEEVVRALARRGVPVSGQGSAVLSTREGRLLRAGLARTLDADVTLALTELIDLLPEHPAHGDWLAQLVGATDLDDPAPRKELLADWWADESFAGLRELRGRCMSLTPEEMVLELVAALDLTERIRSWGDPESRLRTLDAIRALAREHAEQSRAASSPVTLMGLRDALNSLDRGPDLSGIPGTVWVGTIHAAKGLEWGTVVVMLEPKAKDRQQTTGVFVVPAERLDVAAPLAGRALRYWPRVLETFAPLRDGLAGSVHARRRADAEREETGRLQYVALTRSRDATVLSGPGGAPVLEDLQGAPVITWEPGGGAIELGPGAGVPLAGEALNGEALNGERSVLPAISRELSCEIGEDDPVLALGASALAATDLLAGTDQIVGAGAPVPGGGRSFVPARHRASAAAAEAAAEAEAGPAAEGQAQEASATWRVGLPRPIGPALVERGGQHWERVGEAIHAYLALPLAQLSATQRERTAERLVQRWLVERAVGADALLGAGAAWMAFLESEFPGADVLTEQPIAWWNEDEQAMEGWIDTLLRLPSGDLVLVDHKTYPGADPVTHVREHYVGQMQAYARALEAAGTAPARILIHLPLRGEVLEVLQPE